MLKGLFFVLLSGMTFSAYAQTSQYEACMGSLEYYYLASRSEATTVCRQNSSPEFMQCMVHRAENSNIHVLDAALKCSRTRMRIPVESTDPNYVNFRSCPSKLQMRARMEDRRARQICEWDPSSLMQNCIVDLVEQARFHSEHAIQYCAFANEQYRRKIPHFVACVIDNSQRGYDVYSNVVRCDNELTHGRVTKPKPRQDEQPEPKYEPRYPEKSEQPGQVETKPKAPEAKTSQEPASSSGRKVPTPVEIKIEASSNPEVNDQPIETGSTSNSESLPL